MHIYVGPVFFFLVEYLFSDFHHQCKKTLSGSNNCVLNFLKLLFEMLDNLKYKDALYSENIPGQKVSVCTISTLCLVPFYLQTLVSISGGRKAVHPEV